MDRQQRQPGNQSLPRRYYFDINDNLDSNDNEYPLTDYDNADYFDDPSGRDEYDDYGDTYHNPWSYYTEYSS